MTSVHAATARQEQAAASRRRRSAVALRNLAERWVLLELLLLVVIFFSVYPKSSATFASAGNLALLTGNQAVITLLAIAVLCPLIAGHFDFSVGANTALCSVLCASLMSRDGYSLAVSVVLSILLGAAIGSVNGILVARFRLNSFIITLGVSTLIGGVIIWYTQGQTIATGISSTLTNFGSVTLWGIPRLVYLVAFLVAVTWYLLTQTPYGRRLYAIGANARSARLVGIRVSRDVFVSFVTAGVLSGIAGVLAVARAGAATSDPGTSLLFPAIAAVFLGATVVSPGRFNVLGTVIGVLFVATSVSGLTLAGAADWVDPVFNGAALIVAVSLSTLLRRRRTGSADTD
jgi:ribose/xylose/arabinose/galactoside ABC-type transport system permease subunit